MGFRQACTFADAHVKIGSKLKPKKPPTMTNIAKMKAAGDATVEHVVDTAADGASGGSKGGHMGS